MIRFGAGVGATRFTIGLVLSAALLAACVSEPPAVEPDGWFVLQPGESFEHRFEDPGGGLEAVRLRVPAGAVAEPTRVRFSLAEATTPVFAEAGQQLRSPAIWVEPLNLRLLEVIQLGLPWSGFGDEVEAVSARGFRAPGLPGIPAGLWDPVTADTAGLPTLIWLPVGSGGLYWAATFEEQPLRLPTDPVGDPCLEAESSLDACVDESFCGQSGCLGERCGVLIETTMCRPSPQSEARFGCACRCSVSACQWTR